MLPPGFRFHRLNDNRKHVSSCRHRKPGGLLPGAPRASSCAPGRLFQDNRRTSARDEPGVRSWARRLRPEDICYVITGVHSAHDFESRPGVEPGTAALQAASFTIGKRDVEPGWARWLRTGSLTGIKGALACALLSCYHYTTRPKPRRDSNPLPQLSGLMITSLHSAHPGRGHDGNRTRIAR